MEHFNGIVSSRHLIQLWINFFGLYDMLSFIYLSKILVEQKYHNGHLEITYIARLADKIRMYHFTTAFQEN